MSTRVTIDAKELELLKNYLYKNSGIFISNDKYYLFETRLAALLSEQRMATFGALYDYLLLDKDAQMKQKFIDAMSTNETLWFRDISPWKVLEEIILPRLIEKFQRGERKKIRIWSAAVSTGQEIYSTVMCIENYLKKNSLYSVKLSDFEFYATDICSRVLNIAQGGVYDAASMARGIDDYYRDKYFVKENDAWKIDPNIRAAVNFELFNLQNSFYKFSDFDIIFCRYVLIYFSPEMAQEVIKKISKSLNDDGILFIGSYIMYNVFGEEFEPRHYNNFTYYVKRPV